MTWEEFSKLNLAGREVLCHGTTDGYLVGRLTRVRCSVPESDSVFQRMASCRKKLAERMGVKGRNVPCAVLEVSSVRTFKNGVWQDKWGACALFFFPVGDDAGVYESENGMLLEGFVYAGLNLLTHCACIVRPSDMKHATQQTSCPQAADGW